MYRHDDSALTVMDCAEVIVAALVEAITGEDIDRYTGEHFAVAA